MKSTRYYLSKDCQMQELNFKNNWKKRLIKN